MPIHFCLRVSVCVWGQIYQYVVHVTAHASVYTLVLMSLDRYLAVVHPIRSMTIRTRRNAVVALVFLWTIISAANSPMLQHFSVCRLSDSVHMHTAFITKYK